MIFFKSEGRWEVNFGICGVWGGGVLESGICVCGAGTDLEFFFDMQIWIYSWYNFFLPINPTLNIVTVLFIPNTPPPAGTLAPHLSTGVFILLWISEYLIFFLKWYFFNF